MSDSPNSVRNLDLTPRSVYVLATQQLDPLTTNPITAAATNLSAKAGGSDRPTGAPTTTAGSVSGASVSSNTWAYNWLTGTAPALGVSATTTTKAPTRVATTQELSNAKSSNRKLPWQEPGGNGGPGGDGGDGSNGGDGDGGGGKPPSWNLGSPYSRGRNPPPPPPGGPDGPVSYSHQTLPTNNPV